MILARGRFWTATLPRGGAEVVLTLQRDALPDDLQDLRDLRLEVALGRWSPVVKHVLSDRKLLGGILLDFASHEEQLPAAIASERLYFELQRIVLEATASLVALGALRLEPAKADDA